MINQDLIRAVLDHQNFLFDKRKLGYRIVAAYQDSDGVKDFSPNDHATFLATARWNLTDKDEILAEYEYADDQVLGPVIVSWKDKMGGGINQREIEISHPEDREFNPRLPTDFLTTDSRKEFAEYRRRIFEKWNLQLNYERTKREVNGQYSQFDRLRHDSENIFAGTIYNPEGTAPEGVYPGGHNINVGYLRRNDMSSSHAYNATLVGDFKLLFTNNKLTAGGTYFSQDSDVFTESIRDQRIVNVRIPTRGRADIVTTSATRIPMSLEESKTINYPSLGDLFTDEDNDGLDDMIWKLGQESISHFENKAFFGMHTVSFWKVEKKNFERIRIMGGARYDYIKEFNQFTRITRDIETLEEVEIPVFTDGIHTNWSYQ